MEKSDILEEKIDLKRMDIPVIFHRDRLDKINGNGTFPFHWHNKIEILYMISGEVVFTCNKTDVCAKEGDLVIINCNELHSGNTKTDVSEYYCFIIDYSFFGPLKSDAGDIKYIEPIFENMIIFENLVRNDTRLKILIDDLIIEISEKKQGFELALKSCLLNIILCLLRGYAKYKVTPKEYARRLDGLSRFDPVFSFMDRHYAEDITINKLCAVINISRYRFCHLFKEIAGMSAIDYLNRIRVEKAGELLEKNCMAIAEVSQRCGFGDMNYFSRVFKKYNGMSPKTYAGKRNTHVSD